jgi:hypothetical protein
LFGFLEIAMVASVIYSTSYCSLFCMSSRMRRVKGTIDQIASKDIYALIKEEGGSGSH